MASIVTVSDHKVGGTWDDLRATYRALAKQDYREPVEFLLVETEDRTVPRDVLDIIPGVRLVRTKGTTSYDLKNAGAEAANADFVVIIDADCAPHPGWWRGLMTHWESHPEAGVISGRTFYKGEGLLRRILAIIDRTYVDSGRPGPTSAFATNNSAWSRQLLLDYPFSNEFGPFGSEPHAARLKKAKTELRFEPSMIAYHSYDGWAMEREERWHIGFANTRYRQTRPEAPQRWAVRLAWPWIPLTIALSVASDIRRSVRLGSAYGLRWFELPAVWACSMVAHCMEIPGIVIALRGRSMPQSASWR